MATASTMSCNTDHFDLPLSPAPALPLPVPPFPPTPKTSHENDRIRFVLQRSPSKCFKHNRGRSASVTAAETISVEEYAALPSQVQKKYFSPQERIHIVQKAASLKRKSSRSKDMAHRPSTSSDLTPRPKTSLGFRRRLSRTSLVNGRPGRENVSEADAQWFHSLPEKIQRQQFTPEERLKFSSVPPKAANSTAASAPVRVRPTQRPYTSGGHSGHQQRQDSFSSLRKASHPEANLERVNDFLDSGAASDQPPSVGTNESDVDVFSLSMRKASSASSRISTSTQSSRVSNPKVKAQNERHTATRAVALTPIKLPPPKLSPAVLKSHPPPPSQHPLPVVRRAASSPRLIQPPTFLNMEPSPELSPKNRILDPATRHQLREVLSSSEKFDAMLQDGLAPSKEDPKLARKAAASSLRAPSQPPRRSSDISFFDDEDDEDDHSAASVHGPATPNSITDDLGARPDYKSPNTATAIKKFFPSDSTIAPREMTLRLTLTRPDLQDFNGSVTATANATVAPPACSCNVSIPEDVAPISPATPAPTLQPKPDVPEIAPETLLYRAQRTAVSGVELDDTDGLALEPLPPCSEDVGETRRAFPLSHGPIGHDHHGIGGPVAGSWASDGETAGRGAMLQSLHHHGLGWRKVWKGLNRKH